MKFSPKTAGFGPRPTRTDSPAAAGPKLIHFDSVSKEQEDPAQDGTPDAAEPVAEPDVLAHSPAAMANSAETAVADDGEPPVVARLVGEIRSDGTRTIARGAVEEVTSGQRVAVEARGNSPMQLAWALARSMFAAPSLARKSVRALLPGRRRRK